MALFARASFPREVAFCFTHQDKRSLPSGLTIFIRVTTEPETLSTWQGATCGLAHYSRGPFRYPRAKWDQARVHTPHTGNYLLRIIPLRPYSDALSALLPHAPHAHAKSFWLVRTLLPFSHLSRYNESRFLRALLLSNILYAHFRFLILNGLVKRLATP